MYIVLAKYATVQQCLWQCVVAPFVPVVVWVCVLVYALECRGHIHLGSGVSLWSLYSSSIRTA